MKRLFLLVVLASLRLLVSALPATAAESVSSNWSGYAVSGASFSSVSGGWTQPAATCASGSSSAAFWVGLGGNADTSQALEQIGTSSDCSANGTASYSVWYELVPASSVPIELKIAAGNKVWASVKVNGTKVTLTFKNLTRNTSFTKTLTSQVTLTNFGKITFTQALATAGGHTGSVSDQLWTATPIELQSFSNFGPFASAGSSAQAAPAGLASKGSSFTVTYSELDTPAQPEPFAGPSAGF